MAQVNSIEMRVNLRKNTNEKSDPHQQPDCTG